MIHTTYSFRRWRVCFGLIGLREVCGSCVSEQVRSFVIYWLCGETRGVERFAVYRVPIEWLKREHARKMFAGIKARRNDVMSSLIACKVHVTSQLIMISPCEVMIWNCFDIACGRISVGRSLRTGHFHVVSQHLLGGCKSQRPFHWERNKRHGERSLRNIGEQASKTLCFQKYSQEES